MARISLICLMVALVAALTSAQLAGPTQSGMNPMMLPMMFYGDMNPWLWMMMMNPMMGGAGGGAGGMGGINPMMFALMNRWT